MRNILLPAAGLLFFFSASAQDDTIPPPPPQIAPPVNVPSQSKSDTTKNGEEVVEFAEKFPEAKIDLSEFFSRHVKYPDDALEKGREGTVYIKFVVTREGNVESPHIAKGLSDDYGLNQEALRVVKLIPPGSFTPATVRGAPVNCWVSIPVRFESMYEETSPITKDEKMSGFKKIKPVNYNSSPASAKVNLDEFFQKNLQLPEEVKNQPELSRTVYVEALVDKEGRIDPATVSIAQSASAELDKEAKRLVKLLPPFNPATKKGEPVQEWVKIPVKFSAYVKEKQ